MANISEGQIVVDFQACANKKGQPSSAAPCDYTAVLIARGVDGSMARQGIPFGVDQVMRMGSGTYIVFAANRENDGPKSFDAVYEVTFASHNTAIRPLIEYANTSAIFGAYDQMRHRWLAIPITNDQPLKKLALDIINEQGKKIGGYAFGADLTKLPGVTADMFPVTAELNEQGAFELGFWKQGVTENKGGPYVHYVLLPDEQRITATGTR